MPPFIKVMLAVFGGLFLFSAAALTVLTWRGKPAPQAERNALTPTPGYEEMRIPAFSAVNQDNKPFDAGILSGKVTILSFVFTSCPLACPAITSQMKKLGDELKDSSTRFLSLSLDPEHDNPEALKRFAEAYRADLSRWTFGNAGPGTTFRILRENLLEHVETDPTRTTPLPNGETMPLIMHSMYIYLIGPEGQVLGRYDTKRAEEMAALQARARVAAALVAGGVR